MYRAPAVAGSFYPDEPRELQASVQSYLDLVQDQGKVPKAIIVPHAGYIYSGVVAASAYIRLLPAANVIKRVVLIGPSHHVGFQGIALSQVEAYTTPLGVVNLDKDANQRLLKLPFVGISEPAHVHDHCLEVQLPFLQTVLNKFDLVPIITGVASAEQVAAALAEIWGDEETLVVVSSDLSHYLSYSQAQQKDKITSELIENLHYQEIGTDAACGAVPISGLLKLLEIKSLTIKSIDLRNSGDTSGNKQRVVGYGAYVVD